MMKTMFMNYRMFVLGAMAVALFVVSAPALAIEGATRDCKVVSIEAIVKNLDFASNRHEGKFVSITGNKLVMTSKQGQEHSHTLTDDAKLTLDEKACKAADLKPGTKIRVTTQGTDKTVANQIEAIDKNLDFASNRHEGKFVSITGNKLVMTSEDGQEHSHTFIDDVTLTLDGKVCKSSDLEPGMRIRATSKSDDPHVANRIEAIRQEAGVREPLRTRDNQ